jgi:16S rRNA (adenine1518-N6/adenine1519-N6)-dimethyltransferase
MPQTKREIQALLAANQIRPRHRFGQNFMIDGNLLRLVADAALIAPGDRVIEIGPGTGSLTEEILSRGASVVAVEIDRGLATLLRSRFESSANFRLIEGDALAGKHALNSDLLAAIGETKSIGRVVRLAANLPYNIASPLIVELLIAGVDLLAFTVQKEVAARLRAPPGGKDYGALSIMTQLLSRVEVLRTLSPQTFWPMPKIESALVRMTREDRLAGRAEAFGTFVHRLFSSRRKTLRKAMPEIEPVLQTLDISAQLRAEQLSPENCLRLFDEFSRSASAHS